MDVSGAVNFLFSGYNSQINLVSQGVETGFTFLSKSASFYDGNTSSGLVFNRTFLPLEDIRDAYGAIEYPPGVGNVGSGVLKAIHDLNTASYMAHSGGTVSGVPYHLPWNDEATVGIPIPYSISNNNYSFDGGTGQPYPKLSDNSFFSLFSALPLSGVYSSPTDFGAPDMNPNHGIHKSGESIRLTLIQSFNFYIRGRTDYAMSGLALVAKQASFLGSGCVILGDGSLGGQTLGMFIELTKVLNTTPVFSNGVTMALVEATLTTLQTLTGDKSIPDTYASGFIASNFTGDPIEATNKSVNAYCSGLILSIQTLASLTGTTSGYTLTTIPPPTFADALPLPPPTTSSGSTSGSATQLTISISGSPSQGLVPLTVDFTSAVSGGASPFFTLGRSATAEAPLPVVPSTSTAAQATSLPS